ncbi:MAG: hypothetical protein ACKO8I_18620 [Cyanobacteriota bacterium]
MIASYALAGGKPIAQLMPRDPTLRRQLGVLRGSMGEALFEALSDDELEHCGA